MILPDTSIWIDHLNHGDADMEVLLNAGQVVVHPFVLGEVALGSMSERARVMFRLGILPAARKASDKVVLEMIDDHQLAGSGIGFVDAHLVASCLISGNAYLWTRDRRLAVVAGRLGIDATAA